MLKAGKHRGPEGAAKRWPQKTESGYRGGKEGGSNSFDNQVFEKGGHDRRGTTLHRELSAPLELNEPIGLRGLNIFYRVRKKIRKGRGRNAVDLRGERKKPEIGRKGGEGKSWCQVILG